MLVECVAFGEDECEGYLVFAQLEDCSFILAGWFYSAVNKQEEHHQCGSLEEVLPDELLPVLTQGFGHACVTVAGQVGKEPLLVVACCDSVEMDAAGTSRGFGGSCEGSASEHVDQ